MKKSRTKRVFKYRLKNGFGTSAGIMLKGLGRAFKPKGKNILGEK